MSTDAQLPMFTSAEAPVAEPPWVRLSLPGDKLRALWRHPATGWIIRHCGHPTANWPYYAVDPDHLDVMTTDQTRRGFQTLKRARGRIDGVVDGSLRTYDDGGGGRIICHPEDLPVWLGANASPDGGAK